MDYIFVPLQNAVNKIQLEETLALIFFVQLSLNLRNSTVTSYDFFLMWQQHCVFPSCQRQTCTGSLRHSFCVHRNMLRKLVPLTLLYCCSFWCFQLSRLSTIRDSYIPKALLSLLFYFYFPSELFLVFMCVSKMCNSNYGVWVSVCVCVF